MLKKNLLQQMIYISEYLYFPLSVITRRIDFVTYRSIYSSITFLILKDAIAESYIDVSNEESLFEYYEVIKCDRS